MRHPDADDRCERHDHGARTAGWRLERHPVRADAGDLGRQHGSVGQLERTAERRSGRGRRARRVDRGARRGTAGAAPPRCRARRAPPPIRRRADPRGRRRTGPSALSESRANITSGSRVIHNRGSRFFPGIACVFYCPQTPPCLDRHPMATMPPGPARALRASDGALELSEFFAPQRTPSTALPDPDPFLRNLTRGVFEVLAGVREVDQLARWLTEDPYRKLVTRSNLAARARSARGMPAQAPRPHDPLGAPLVPGRRRRRGCRHRAGTRAHAGRGAAARGHGRALARDIPRAPLRVQTDERVDPSVVAGPLACITPRR